ncbi:antibiotic biosynthesis monooxygenase family protein [Mesobacterium pallidum]|uniref:antibiotic biosynthesis monooxygenase family protein n=1 Tax=Mesobacterium pallidum TaxID=2872037 RepID=UPI001EE38420|nr:antibiotic biosynthesis monooxygenase [Mesobacterium pallidum]
MIIRIFRVITEPGQRDRFEDFFRNTAVPLMKGTDGIEDITFGLPRPETPDEFSIVMVWRDLDALRAFVGEDWQVAHVHPDEVGIVKERHLHHYELLPS